MEADLFQRPWTLSWKAKLLLVLCMPVAGVLVILTAIPAVIGMAFDMLGWGRMDWGWWSKGTCERHAKLRGFSSWPAPSGESSTPEKPSGPFWGR